MIYTVTLNPSIDFIVRIDKVEIGEVNRMDSDDKFAGGKGINVSRILQRLGIDNTATGFIGGFTGRFVTDGLDAEGIKTKFVAVDQDTRIKKLKLMERVQLSQKNSWLNWRQSFQVSLQMMWLSLLVLHQAILETRSITN